MPPSIPKNTNSSSLFIHLSSLILNCSLKNHSYFHMRIDYFFTLLLGATHFHLRDSHPPLGRTPIDRDFTYLSRIVVEVFPRYNFINSLVNIFSILSNSQYGILINFQLCFSAYLFFISSCIFSVS